MGAFGCSQGRVDCIRSASSEALEWAKAVVDGVTLDSDNDKECDGVHRKVRTFYHQTFRFFIRRIFVLSCREYWMNLFISNLQKEYINGLFQKAVARQTDIMVQNILGQGIDIHILGLREACLELEGELCELFTDESYAISNCFLLSTSQVCHKNHFQEYIYRTIKHDINRLIRVLFRWPVQPTASWATAQSRQKVTAAPTTHIRMRLSSAYRHSTRRK